VPDREPLDEFDQRNINNWHMPEKYYNIDVKQWLLDKTQTEEERDRVLIEYSLFENKKFVKVLQFLIYFVDTLRANNIVWGVGRGSSVASFCLFLIGVHKINPLLYNLDIKEFLR
jgi:DNA polymerase III alpha subunit